MTPHSQEKNRLVYSTEQGQICPQCARPVSECACRRKSPRSGDDVIRVRREVKGRRGKTVTTISGIPGGDGNLRKIAKYLKNRCGTGGSSKEGMIVIQGDHREIIIAELNSMGYTARPSGG